MKATPAQVPRRAQHFLLDRLDENVLLYYPGMTKTIQLNHTASIVWELCDGQRSIQEIAEALAAVYPEDASGMLDDVEAAVRRLAAEGAVEFA